MRKLDVMRVLHDLVDSSNAWKHYQEGDKTQSAEYRQGMADGIRYAADRVAMYLLDTLADGTPIPPGVQKH